MTLSPTRRRALGAGAAAAAWLSGTPALGSARAKVVVVGGGWGGLGAARALARDGRVDITLVEPNAGFMSCPLSAHYIAGLAPASDFQRDYSRVDAAGIRRLRDRVTAIERTTRQVVTAANGALPYDYLVLSPGIEYDEDAIAGYAQAREQLPVGFRAFEQIAVRAQVEQFLDTGGTFLISVPTPPYRCPPAPYERACLIAEQMRRRRMSGKVVIADANPHPMPPPTAAPLLEAIKGLYAAQIEYLPSSGPTAVDVGRKAVTTPMGELPYTYANLVLPMRAPALLRSAGLAQRWAAVKLPSFEAQDDAHIFIIGDAQGSPLPKSGHVAFGSGQQVAADILRRLAGKPAPAPGTSALPPGICWASTTHDKAIMIGVSANVAPGEEAKVRLQVDPHANVDSGTAAMEWGRGIWRGMLG
jgi:NADPH-dependent 2,4-dienoyl-CoA reductase/sulfur reductase-like enzyme